MGEHAAKIMEVFRSVQGEGPYVGVDQVFVRFFECNMHCAWCDTPASIGDTSRQYKEYLQLDLLQEVTRMAQGVHSISITGGEPLVQADFLVGFLPLLRSRGFCVYLETNGTLPASLARVKNDVDIVAMDIKLPSSTKERSYWDEHAAFLMESRGKPTFVKVVVSQGTDQEDVMRAAGLVAKCAPGTVFILQPNYFDMLQGPAVSALCARLQHDVAALLDDVRVIPQVHKFMKLP